MKTLHLGMIIGISVIALTSFGVFIEKLNDYQQQPYVSLFITGLKENYIVNDSISFSATLEGYGTGCGDTTATITKENDSQYQSPRWSLQPQCVDHANLHDFKFTALSENTSINQIGNYILTVSFDDLFEHQKTVKQKFSVFASKNTSVFDTGVTQMSVNVTNTNFTVNYDIAGNGKILDAKMNTPSQTLTILINATENGQLVIVLPRNMIHSTTYTNMDDMFIVLSNQQEIQYKEIRNTLDARTLLIPFQKGVDKIEIVGTSPI